jgi:hypothetical protein
LDRYADHNDYRNFKRTVHDALHPGENQPPVPHASTWFPEDNPKESAGARRRRNNTIDNTNNSDDDEIEMVGLSTNLKCPLSLQVSLFLYAFAILQSESSESGSLSELAMSICLASLAPQLLRSPFNIGKTAY